MLVHTHPSGGWPAQPSPGRPVSLPLRYPPTLLEALGYQGDAARVVVQLSASSGRARLLQDDDRIGSVDDLGWQVFIRHPYIAAVLAPYLTDASSLRLLIDRSARTVGVVLAGDVLPRTPPARPAADPTRTSYLTLDRKPVSPRTSRAQAAARAALAAWFDEESRRLWTTASRPDSRR